MNDSVLEDQSSTRVAHVSVEVGSTTEPDGIRRNEAPRAGIEIPRAVMVEIDLRIPFPSSERIPVVVSARTSRVTLAWTSNQ